VTLVCTTKGIHAALRFIADTVGLGHALDALDTIVAADHDPAPTDPHPECDFVGTDGACLDEGSPDAAAPSPEPDPGGAGIAPPSNCMDTSTAQTLIDSMPINNHHVATWYGPWAETFDDIVSGYGLSLEDAARSWNVIAVPHRGPHPAEYHRWVQANLELANDVADGDVVVFKALFKQWVVDRVQADPTITRLAYWKCRR
jgi:hypothetical protein